jgi:hypothetical protein
MSTNFDEQDARITAVIDGEEDPMRGSELWLKHLSVALRLPCDVVGSEDFRWEEPYILGFGDRSEYELLRTRQPSYLDVFRLERLEPDAADSEWAMRRDDTGACVRRERDGREFLLGLSELKAVDHGSPNGQVLNDFAVWFVNYK